MKKPAKHLRNILTIAVFILAISASGVLAATFTVTNTNDSGAGSLRDAINQANTNAQADTINFDPSFFNVARTITLTSGEIAITPDGTNPGMLVKINGPGSNLLTISGGNTGRIFLLGPQANANVTMSGMTLRNGNGLSSLYESGYGGAIYSVLAADLTLNSMVIRNNVVTAVANGGAIFSNGSRNVAINDSLITENSAYGGGGLVISNENYTFTMRNSIVSNNTASSADVGGISIYRGTIVIEKSQITGNVATRSAGGIDVYQAARLDVSDTTISGNDGRQNNGGGLSTDGQGIVNLRRLNVSNNMGTGISVRQVGGVFTLIDSTVSNNTLRDYSGFFGEAGGGIFTSGESTAPVKIINTTISGNSAPDFGGGIFNFSFGLEIINSTIVNNSVTNTGSYRGGGGIADGERIRSGGNGYLFRFKIQNSIIAGNTAPNGPDVYSGFDSNGYNIIGNTADSNNSTANTGDQFNVNPNVGALANNGGPTQTHALLAGSPAINAGSNSLAVDQNGIALRFDQRGPCFNRRVGGTTDIGAFEFGAVQLSGKNAGFDFDGDCKADLSVFRPTNGVWYLQQSTNGFIGYAFGTAGDLIVPADYDGDGKTDIAVFRPSNGVWYLQQSTNGFVGFAFGTNGDIPMPGDYDGDGKADIAVFRPSNGVWYLQQSTAGFVGVSFGAGSDIPVAADYDGDGKTNIAVFRPSTGTWFTSIDPAINYGAVVLGAATDKPVPADYDGDGKTDIAVFSPTSGVWTLRQTTAGVTNVGFGAGTDLPVPADYDGDGKADLAVFRSSNGVWYLQQSTSGFNGILFGATTDKPIPNAFVR